MDKSSLYCIFTTTPFSLFIKQIFSIRKCLLQIEFSKPVVSLLDVILVKSYNIHTKVAHTLQVKPTVTQAPKRLLSAYFGLRLLLYSFLYSAPIPHRFLSDQNISFSRDLFLFGVFQSLLFETLQGLSLAFFLCLKTLY